MNFAFLLTFSIIALIPGANNILSTAIAMSFGYKKSLFMNFGANLANFIIVFSVCLGLSSMMTKFPQIFTFLRIIGICYMFYIAFVLYKTSQIKSINLQSSISNKTLFFQGFINSISNIGLWFLMISFLPPYVEQNLSILVIVIVILILEFSALNIYAIFGSTIRRFLSQKISLLNKISAICIILLAIWVFIGLIK